MEQTRYDRAVARFRAYDTPTLTKWFNEAMGEAASLHLVTQGTGLDRTVEMKATNFAIRCMRTVLTERGVIL